MLSPKSNESSRIPAALKWVLVLLFVSVFINYIDRANLGVAAPLLKDELRLSGSQLGTLFSAFFLTYAVLQPFAGWLVDRFEVEWVFAFGFFLWSLATALTGFVHAFAIFLGLRLALGVGESVTFPSYSKIIATRFPENHRGLANSCVAAGLVLGPGFGMLAGGMLMARFGWRPFFILLGFASMLWLVPWIALKAPRLPQSDRATGVPNLFEFLRMRSAWGTCIGLFSGNYVNYFLLTWLPIYIVRERGFSMNQMAKIAGGGYFLAAGAATAAGWLSDRWIQSGATPTLVRKTVVVGGIALAAIFLGLSLFGNSAFAATTVVLGIVFFGISSSNVWAITQTLAGPKAAGRWTGFQNCAGNMAGVIGPAITGFVLDRFGHFFWAFVILGVVVLLGILSWLFLVGSVEQVVWRKRAPLVAAVSS
jgi:MFS transporter, ACS family, D-galactonate transporter